MTDFERLKSSAMEKAAMTPEIAMVYAILALAQSIQDQTFA